MKTCTFTIATATALVATASPTTAQPSHFRRLQQFGNPNNANGIAWPQVGNVGGPWGNVGGPWGYNQGGVNTAEAFPQAGAATGALQTKNLEQASTTTAPPASQPTATAASGAAAAAPARGEQPPAQATIMVLLPDFLAPTSSGSGSTMVIAGGGKSGELVPKSPTDTGADAIKKSAATTTLMRTVPFAVVLLATVALGLF